MILGKLWERPGDQKEGDLMPDIHGWELKFHGANSLQSESDLLLFVLNPPAWGCRPKEGMWLGRDLRVGGMEAGQFFWWDSPGSAGGWKWCRAPSPPRVLEWPHRPTQQPQTHGSSGVFKAEERLGPRKMCSDQWVYSSQWYGFPLLHVCSSPVTLLHLNTAKLNLQKRKEEKATSARGVDILALHLPDVLKDRRWRSQTDDPGGNACDPFGACLWWKPPLQ